MLKVFIINLPSSLERKTKMQAQIDELESNDLEFIFFKAVDASKGEEAAFKKYINDKKAIRNRAMPNTKGENACYASHFSLWQKCLELDEPIVVLEDDISFNPNFLDSIRDIKASGFSYVRLACIDEKGLKPINKHFYYTLEDVAGGQGYYLTPRAARAFSAIKYWDLPADLQMDYVARHKIDNIIYKPFSIRDELVVATTIPNRYSVKKPFKYKLIREFFRIFTQSKKAIFKAFYKPPKCK
ncbi:glycosyltransferase family 25 protein [Helicobacter sp. 11S02629-2]|uniref:glycosyltransferase family 25 protein n=1 Tax=Helicobacter sp. 11S02629-2 TaxID=1476195 RepID=UPI000BA6CEF9|nr:glycosyltransferase family 25 protein [Helicobacter sp. 11S02629-2]PAF44354.1 hypothetical protein BKH40_05515 [Helicobacter sp. 11S02629-2]